MKTSSSMVTPSQMNVWLEILQFFQPWRSSESRRTRRSSFRRRLAAVQVDELRELDVFSQLDVRRDADEFAHSWTTLPFCCSDWSAASSMRTTRSPAAPSLNGVLSFENAIHEICGFDLQRFHLFDLRRPHVAGAVADEQFDTHLRRCVICTPLS